MNIYFTYVRFMSKSCLGFIVITVLPSTSETVVSISYLSDPWRLNPFPFGEEFDATLISEFKPFTSVGYLHSSLRPRIVDDPDPVAKLEKGFGEITSNLLINMTISCVSLKIRYFFKQKPYAQCTIQCSIVPFQGITQYKFWKWSMDFTKSCFHSEKNVSRWCFCSIEL